MRPPAALALAALTLIGLAQPAHAKGPESAAISGPGFDRPIELLGHAGSRETGKRLMEQTGLWFASGDLPVPIKEPPQLGPGYTLTWVRSGSPGESVEDRTFHQVIYATTDGLIIHTPVQPGLLGWGGERGWFRAPIRLKTTLAELLSAAAESSEREVIAQRGTDYGFWYPAILGFVLVAGGGVGIVPTLRGRKTKQRSLVTSR